MAINDAATLVVGTARFYYTPYVASAPEALPADLRAPGEDWIEFGHTSLDEIFSASSDGGESTTVGSLQNKALRTTRSARTETFAITLQQWNKEALKLFHGSNATEGSAGQIQVPINPLPTTASFLAVFEDGVDEVGIYAEKAEIFRGDDMSIGDTESLASLPLAITPLAHGSNTWAYSVTPKGEPGP